MFGIGWTELLLVGVIALVVLKPQDYPDAMRSLGRLINKARQMAGEFQGQFNEALRDANLDDVRKTLDEVRDMRNLSPVQKVTETLSRFADETRGIKNEIEQTNVMLGDQPIASAPPVASSPAGTDPTESLPPPIEPAPPVDLSAFTAPETPASRTVEAPEKGNGTAPVTETMAKEATDAAKT